MVKTMELTINSWWWTIPTVLTISIWLWACFSVEESGTRGFIPDNFFECVIAMIITPIIWLVYFIIF